MKKFIGMLLIVAMIASMLVGCGASGGNEGNKDVVEDVVEATEEKEEAAEETVQEVEEELEYVKLKIVSVGDAGDASPIFVEELNKLLMRDLNCEVEIEYVSWSDWKTKYPLYFASGEEFDFIFTANWCFYADQASKGGFYELVESDIEKYMPLTWEAVSADRWNQTRINGKIFMIPQTDTGYYSDPTCYVVRGDLMEEAGLTEISSPADMETYLDNVVANHPEMNVVNITGASSATLGAQMAMNMLGEECEYGYTSATDTPALNGYLREILPVPVVLDYSDISDLKLVDEEKADAYYLKVFEKCRELQQKGYWSSDCLSQNEGIDTYFKEGNGALAFEQLRSIIGWGEKLTEVVPDANPRYFRWVDKPLHEIPGTNNGIGIHATSKNPERAMMVIDKLGYDQEYNDLLYLGIEGVHYTLNENGTYTSIGNPEYYWGDATNMGFVTTCTRDSDKVNPEEFQALLDDAEDNCVTPVLCTFNFDNTPVATEFAAVNALKAQYYPILAAGMTDDVEGLYNEYKIALKAAGMDALVEEYISQAQVYLDSLK